MTCFSRTVANIQSASLATEVARETQILEAEAKSSHSVLIKSSPVSRLVTALREELVAVIAHTEGPVPSVERWDALAVPQQLARLLLQRPRKMLAPESRSLRLVSVNLDSALSNVHSSVLLASALFLYADEAGITVFELAS